MISRKINDDAFEVTLTREELLILCRCIEETRKELPDWEFPIRVGAQTHEADAILAALLAAAGNHPDGGA